MLLNFHLTIRHLRKRETVSIFLTAFILSAFACGGGGTGVPLGQTARKGFLTIATTRLSSATAGAPYSFQLIAQGGAPPLTWTVALGSLPPGISINAQTGQLSGTSAITGSFAVTIAAVDSTLLQQERALAAFTLDVVSPPLTIVTAAMPPAVLGKPYTLTLNVLGGLSPYYWTVSAGALPPGLQLDPSTGQIFGTPTALGTFAFTIQVMDSSSPQNRARLIVASLSHNSGG
jgi:putative Ig domain-containing protein